MASSLADARVLVVGGAGFVGSNLVHRLLAERVGEVVIVDNLLSADMTNLPKAPNLSFVLGSIAEARVLDRLPRRFDLVFHLATYHGNQSSMADPVADHDNNTLTTLMLCEWLAHRAEVDKVVYAAAGCTVAEKTFEAAAPTQEDAPVSLYLDSPYQISKIIGELYGNYYFKRHGVPFVKARFQNVYGPGEILGAGHWRGTPATVWRNVVPTFVWKPLAGAALPVEKGGVATRDFIYVDDIVEGLIACALTGEPGGVYNLASGAETSIRALAEAINELAGNETPIALAPARDWDRSGRRFGDIRKAREALGFSARVGLRDGLSRTVAWTRANRATIARCMAQHRWFMPELAALPPPG